MSNPLKTLDRLLAENGFREISSRRESRIFRSDRLNQVFVMSRIRCDDRWAKATILELLRAIKAPPRSIVKAQEDFETAEAVRIGLLAQPKTTAGVKRSDVKTKGTGFRYYDPDDDLSAEEKKAKAEKRAAELALQAVQREQRQADEAKVREILKPWSDVLKRIKEMRVISTDPLSLKFLHTELARFWDVSIVGDEFHFQKSTESGGTRLNGFWRPDGSGTTEKQLESDGATSIGVRWDEKGTSIDEIRLPDGGFMLGVYQPKDAASLSFDFRRERNGVEVVCGVMYPDGRMYGAKQFEPNLGTFYGSECTADYYVWTAELFVHVDGTVRRRGITTDRGLTWSWDGEPAPKAPTEKEKAMAELSRQYAESSKQSAAKVSGDSEYLPLENQRFPCAGTPSPST